MKKVLITLLTIALSTSLLTGCGKSGQADNNKEMTIRFASFFPEDHPQNKAIKEVFIKQVEEKSNGKIKVELYDNNKLGDEKQAIESCKMGTVEMTLAGLLQGESFPKLRLLEYPYLFESYEHAMKTLDNEKVMNKITEGMPESGTRPLAYSINGFRVVSNSKHPINSIDDIKDIKLRMPLNNMFIEAAKAWGFPVVTIPMTELFTALQQKVVDGQENPAITLYTSGWYEVQNHLAITNHIFSPTMYEVSESFWKKLTPEQQQIISDASKASAQYERELFLKQEKEVLKELEGKGVKITYPDLKPFMEKSKSVYDSAYSKNPELKGLVEEIKALK